MARGRRPLKKSRDAGRQRQGKRLTRSRALRWGLPILLLLLVGFYGYVSYSMASGVTKLDRSPLEEHPTEYGLPYENVAFSPRGDEWNNIVLRGWLIEQERLEDPRDELTVILVHGLNSNRAGDNSLKLARRLFDRGFNVLLFDIRGHGESDGDRLSAGYFERWDVLGAYDFLVHRGASPGKVGLVGWSLGGATALLAAAEEPALRAVVADSSFADVHDLIAQETARATVFPQWIVPVFIPGMKVVSRVLYGIDVGAVVPEKAAGTLGYPILVIHGGEDSRVPAEQSVRIHTAASVGSELWLVHGSEHADAVIDAPDEYVERVDAYFRSRLGENVTVLW